MPTNIKSQPTELKAQEPKRKLDRHQSEMAILLVVFGISLVPFVWFVNALAGIDGDTIFIAVLCSMLSTFVVKAGMTFAAGKEPFA